MKTFPILILVCSLFLTTLNTRAQGSKDETSVFTSADSLVRKREFEKARKSYQNILDNAIKKDLIEIEAQTYLKIGIVNYHLKQRDSAEYYFNKATEVPETKKNLETAANAYCNLGSLKSRDGELTSALEHFQEALSIYNALGNDSLAVIAHYNLGLVYKTLSNTKMVTEHMLICAKILQQRNQNHLLDAVYNTLANTLREQKKYVESIEYHQKAIEVRRKTKNISGIGSSYNDLGNTYKMMKDFDQAISFYKKSLHIKDSLDSSPKSISKPYSNMGEAYLQMKEYKTAKIYFLKSLNLKEIAGDKSGIAYVQTQLGELYVSIEDYDSALYYLNIGLENANKAGAKSVIEENLKLHKMAYGKIYDYENAFLFGERYNLIHDEIFDTKRDRSAEDLRVSYEVEKKERELLTLYKDNEMQQVLLSQQALWNKGLTVIILLFIIISGLLFFAFRLSRKNTALQKSLHHDTQHRTKNFLQTLISLFSFQASQLDDPKAKAAVQEGENRVNAMMMIHRYFSNPNLNDTLLNFSEYASNLSEQLKLSFQKPGNKTELELELDLIMLEAYQSTPLALILNELVSNAFKYATDNNINRVNVSLKKTENKKLHLCVRDNGPGLPDSLDIDLLNSSGLKLVRIFVKQLKGELTFKNDNGLICDVFVKI